MRGDRAGRRFPGGVPRAWILPLLALVGVLGAAYLDRISRSVVADLLAWWPVWSGLVVLAWLARGRTLGRLRLAGLVPLLALGLLAVFLAGHLAGWRMMPSSSARLVGPGDEEAVAEAALSAHPSGELVVETEETGYLYLVEPVRRGGKLPIPVATEQSRPGYLGVALEPDPDPGWYLFSGWRVVLDPDPAWSLSLGGEVVADLTSLTLRGLQLHGSGLALLGEASTSVPVAVSGDFRVSLPSGVPARVIGDATVPDDWVSRDDGLESPVDGDGWVISVDAGSTLEVDQP